MRRIRTFTDWLLMYERREQHQSNVYSSIYGKIMYPVANNPLDDVIYKRYYKFDAKKSRYTMVR